MTEKSAEDKKMSLWEHLEELRWIIFKILALVLVATGLGFIYINEILEILIGPLNELVQKKIVVLNQAGPFDGVMIKMKVGILAGIVVSIPFVIFFLWSFVAPGLKKRERDAFWWIFSSINILFLIGIIAGYFALYIVMPMLVSFGVEGAQNLWRIREYIDFVFVWIIGAGLMFQLPLVIVILVRLKLVKLASLKKMRKYALVASFVISAVITPTPDAISQLIVAIPLYLLYEIGIFVASLQKTENDDSV
ncbi:MAG TPA: twin-arginine translocase subunit TatC [Lentisphaeria bacterium]|nr:MAG: twin arginine-targeting protein translocase TatC [Lentisphaerae bacterium GWF2_50_93]HCE45971.1 twin-arginine translocase subunit TatC [Lentisphaeria bacterium]